ncbi:MAG TPA: serine hydrolase domain-containing protein [Candidatus Angelobacter sp.]|nr:serine hydrolase domain-containing protein [Candidatus Angelobacter sp.]
MTPTRGSSRFGQLLLCIFSFCPMIWTQSVIDPPPRQAKGSYRSPYAAVDDLLRKEYLKDKRGGIGFGIVRGGKLVWTRSYGYADERKKVAATVDTEYPIGSITKQFLGLMLLQLADAGRVHLSEPVARYYPDIQEIENPYPWSSPITFVQLASMSAGLPASPFSVNDPDAQGTMDQWEENLHHALKHTQYVYEPGTRRLYSNIGYAILAAALEHAAGRKFQDYIELEILRPLRMNDTGFTDRASAKMATGYFLGRLDVPADTPQRQNTEFGYLFPAGGLYSSIKDLAKFMMFELGHGPDSVLSGESLERAFTGMVVSDANLVYGDGIPFSAVRNEDSTFVAVGHGGLRLGFTSYLGIDRSTDTGIILLSNMSGGKADYKPLCRRILSMLNPRSRGGTGRAPSESH